MVSDGERRSRLRPERLPAELYTRLQRTTGNRAVAGLVTRHAGNSLTGGQVREMLPPPSARHDGLWLQGVFEDDSYQARVRSLFSRVTGVTVDELGARTLIAVGVDREGDLTNALFWLRHPEAAFRKIRPDEPELAEE
jgi:hypothetical protein